MRKRIFSLLLVLCMLSSLFVTFPVTASAATSDIYTYEILNGQATITDCDECASGAIEIPSTLGGYLVTSIGHGAFDSCALLESITIPSSVTSIGEYAFHNCALLESITIPNSVTRIGDWAFSACDSLTSIIVDENNESYSSDQYGVLYDKQKTSLIQYPTGNGRNNYDIPSSVTSIGAYAFVYGYSLTSITIPNSVTSIGDGAFHWCKSLTSITIPNSVTRIGDWAFYHCDSLASITIPNSVTSIGEGAFESCSSLTSITIPKSVTSIGDGAFSDCFGLTSITIPSSVTSIGALAFEHCYSLTSITIPSSVTSIGSGTFCMCKSLTSITIPNSVTSIGEGAFSSCYSLTSITIPNSVTSIGDGAFRYCDSLTSITIPNSVTSIGEYAFYNCDLLEIITIPNSVTSIGEGAFWGCTGLTDVYYTGSEEEWKNISISSYNSPLTNATIHYNCLPPLKYEYLPPLQIATGSFHFASGKGSGYFKYKEYNYFSDSSYTYNHDLAITSLKLAMSAFGKNTDNEGNPDDSKAYINAENMLKDMGFLPESIIANDWYKTKPKRNSIGIIAGRKHIAFPGDDDYTLIAVAIRGGNYGAEWGGNFVVGTDGQHEGFEIARDQVVEFIQNYISGQRIGGKIKLWITGYSRAAATANLTAAYFDENPSDAGVFVTLDPKDIYAYCFETPMGVINPNNESGLYDNIFSIVNQHDFVPMVAMRKWGFDRYGVTKYLPSSYTHSNYEELKDDMVEKFEEYCDDEYLLDNFVYYFAPGVSNTWESRAVGHQGAFTEQLMDKLADSIGSREFYEDYLQEIIAKWIGEEALGGGKIDPLLESLASEIDKQSASLSGSILLGKHSTYLAIRKVIKDSFINVGMKMSNDAIDAIAELILDMGIGDLYTIIKNAALMKQSHFPELCLAWMETIDEDDFTDKRLRTLFVNCPVDLKIYDSNDNLVAAVYDDVPQKIEGSAIVPFIDENGQKIVYLPQDEEYRIEVIATDDGEVTYSIQEQNAETREVKVINYNSMTVSQNDILTGTAEKLSETEVATYALTSNSVTVEEPEVIENATPVAVTPVAEGNGNVMGGGLLLKGEYAQFTATPLKDETFLGWYNGDTLVSTDATYRFQVSEAITFTAKFTENTCEILYMTDDEDVVVVDRILKGSKVTFPSMTQNPNYMNLGIYTDAEYTVPADENTTYSKDTILYAKVLTKDEWIQYDEVNDKVVVYTPTAISNVQLMVALYEGEKLSELKSNVVDLVEGKNEFDNPIATTGTADTLKIFVWDGLAKLQPLFKNCAVDLKQ